MKKPLLKLDNISFTSPKNRNQQILKDINLEIFSSEIFGLTGESGSGKTTLAKIISGLEHPTSGKKFFNNKELPGIDPDHQIQILFQNYTDMHDPIQKIGSAFNEILGLRKSKPKEFFKIKKDVLNLVGLSDELLNYYPYHLSGGQLQRLALAKILLLNPKLIILDEPFASQDVTAVKSIIKILFQINQTYKTTFICISHDLHYLIKFCNRIGIMKDGEMLDIINIKSQNTILIEQLNDYTKYLFSVFNIELSPYGVRIVEK